MHFNAFVFFGFLVHLTLDELYSVDLEGAPRVNQSFGTALEFWDYSNWTTSLLMLGATIIMFVMTPDVSDFGEIFFNSDTYGNIINSFLPSDTWFL